MTTKEILDRASAAKETLSSLSSELKNRVLLSMASALERHVQDILSANARDVMAARSSLSSVMIDRLLLTRERIFSMANGIREVAKLPDPVGRVLSSSERGDGLLIEKISSPVGVLAIIYESRPNVTSDAAALAFKSGNVCILRAGKEAHESAAAITESLREAIADEGVNPDMLLLVEDTSRQSAEELMQARGVVDLLIPRGGKGLIQACVDNAKVPCIETGTGICHIYIDESADEEKALAILENAKTSRPSVCNAAEVCLVHENIAPRILPKIRERLVCARERAGEVPVELRLDATALRYTSGKPAGANDFDTEFLDYILAVCVVKDTDEAIRHIALHSTHHSEAIVTENKESASRFVASVDSAAVYVNASTRFTDGGEFGLGCEMGISTQKLHARGPMGLAELCTYKYVVRGNGHVR